MFDQFIDQSLDWLKTTSNRDLLLQGFGVVGIGWAALERFVFRKNDYAAFMRKIEAQGRERDALKKERD